MTRLRVGLFGCGGIGIRHAQSVAALGERMELVACCGRDMARTQSFAADHGGTAYVDLDRMLGEARLDLCIVTHPPYTRRGEVERIAAAGVHLLVEKPIALMQETADAMVAAVEAAGVTAAIGFMYRHGDAVKAWDASDTGRVGMMTGSFQCNHLHAHWWREEAKSGGQILEQLLHLIDLVRHFMGEPDTVAARRARLFHEEPGYDVEDVSAMIFGWDDGRIATLNANNIAVTGIWHKEWALFAQKMTGRFTGWNDAEFRRSDNAADPRILAGGRSPFEAQLLDLADAIRDRRPPHVPLAEGARTLRLALAARQSADERREIRLT
ncbi:Gfo/Idh/MocA family oxidoreductase [Sphingomonas sp.]|uniref:Gfo/Idh/MocA family protein n=1 Tax=Sphingomonas sp. TaxID=28214 RepID=UPI001D422997|nr:Gfo/Idh/MocA family oxidoreductase [Sphingomonas sp.]MBX9796988.1 Gfo/Idh/MocA family oxidoreductase [Sphingomonas sp.]